VNLRVLSNVWNSSVEARIVTGEENAKLHLLAGSATPCANRYPASCWSVLL